MLTNKIHITSNKILLNLKPISLLPKMYLPPFPFSSLGLKSIIMGQHLVKTL